MRVYVDSSALIKRSVQEPESTALEATLDTHADAEDTLVSSSLALIEVSRALMVLQDDRESSDEVTRAAIEAALSGVAERAVTEDVISLARRIAPSRLRALDAIHLATAVLVDADLVIAYDNRLIEACHHNGLATSAPGR